MVRSNLLLISVTIVALLLCWGQAQTRKDYVCDRGASPLAPLEDACLGCMCSVSSECNVTIGCINQGGLCGPFLISQAFWVDAGSCNVQNDPRGSINTRTAFEACANDLSCATDTVRNYMIRFEKDCNGDQVVTCEDFVMLHKNGGWNCGKNLEGTDYWNLYSECRDIALNRGINI